MLEPIVQTLGRTIGAMPPIQDGEHTIISIEVFMVLVMKATRVDKFVAAVLSQRDDNAQRRETQQGDEVGPEQCSTNDRGRHIGQNELNRVRVICGQRCWGCPLMMHLMNALVKLWPMEDAMGIVEEHLVDKKKSAALTGQLFD